MQGETREAQKGTDISPLELELREALGSMANLAARVELARDLGEINEESAERVKKIAAHLGTVAHRLGGESGDIWLGPSPTHNGNGNGNGHTNGHSQAHSNGSSNGHGAHHVPEISTSDNGHSTIKTEKDATVNGNGHKAHTENGQEPSERSPRELFVDLPPLITESFTPEEYETFSERDVAVAMHFMEHRGSHVSVKQIVNKLAGEEVESAAPTYDTLRKGVSTSLKKLRETQLGQQCLHDNGQPTKARRYIMLTEEQAQEYPAMPASIPELEETLSPEEQLALAAKRETLFSAFLPYEEKEPTGSVPCIVIGDKTLRIGDETYEYKVLGMKDGHKPTTIGVYNGLVELLVKQGKTEIQPYELTELLGFESSSVVGVTFKKFQEQFSRFPFIRTGIAKATRYRRNPDIYFTDDIESTDLTGSTAAIQEEADTAIDTQIEEIEVPEFPKTLELTEWGLSVNLDEDEDDVVVRHISLDGTVLRLRDISMTTLLALTATRQSILQSDLLASIQGVLPEMTDEKLRGCLHEIRNTLEYYDVDKHLYQRQMPERDGVSDTLWNLNGIINDNGVLDFLALASVTYQ